MSDLVLPSRSKQKRERVPVQSEEEKEAEQKLSKRAKKKIEQLQVRDCRLRILSLRHHTLG